MNARHIIIASALAASVGLTGCGSSGSTEEAPTTSTVTEKSGYVIYEWDGGTIPYHFDEAFSEEEREAMRGWMMEIEARVEGVVAFVESEFDGEYVCSIVKNYGSGSYARLGSSAESHLHLGSLDKGTFKHEMFHVMGFEHEFKRPDRDQWINVHIENVADKYVNNVAISDALLYDFEDYPFDLHSISLYSYSQHSLSANGGIVFEGMTYLGDGNLSSIDAARIIDVYGE